MAKLTHIDDLEQQRAEEDEREMREAQEAMRAQEAERGAAQEAARKATLEAQERKVQEQGAVSGAGTPDSAGAQEPELDVTEQAVEDSMERSADEEADFHGLTSEESMSGMQKVLIVLAAIVFIAAIAYLVNSWFHFV